MSERSAYDALPRNLPREVRSKVLEFEQAAATQKFRYDKLHPDEEHSEGGAVIPVFEYTDLPPDKKRIRLLRLYPGVLDNPQIDCELFEAEFDDNYNLVKVQSPETPSRSQNSGKMTYGDGRSNISTTTNSSKTAVPPPATDPATGKKPSRKKDQGEETIKEDIIEYEALSWRWGNERHGECAVMIHRDGALYRKRVSQTLGLALKYLRFEKDRIIWIDAICINQEDDDERSSQVSMMSLVYTGAKQVCVWLGEDDEESTTAIRFIRNEIKGLKNFDQLCTDPKNAKKWGTLLGLMQRDWFSRRWVVQEVVLARDAIVYCGPDKIPWRELAIAVELFVEVETATHRLSELMKKDEKYNLIPNWFEHISELGASLLVNATARVFRESRHDERALAQRSLLSLEYLVTSLSIFDCGRPHDSIYALVAVARDARPFAPSAFSKRTKEALVAEVCSHYLEQKPYVLDYNRPYADVCKDFVHFCVLRCASTDKIQALNILCRPWAKDWRPGEYGLRDAKDNSQDPKVNKAKRTTLIKRKTPWMRRLQLGELKKKSQCKDSCSAYFFELLEDVKPAAERDGLGDDEKVGNVDNASMDAYRKRAEVHEPVSSVIQQWFPTETHEARNIGAAETEAGKGGTKMSKRKKAKKFKKLKETAPETDIRKENELGLPSWVAKITGAPFDIFPHAGMDMVKMGRKNADPLTGIPQDGHRNYSAGQTKRIDLDTLKFRKRPRCNHYSLYVKGFWFDTVEEVAQVSQGGAIPGTWLDLAGWSEARRPVKPGTELKDPPDELWRTLVADRGRHDRNPPYYYARACRETIIKGGLQSGAVDTSALIHNERNSIIAEFCRRVQSVIWNRALIRTENGALGLVSDKVKEGDRICIIYGCTVPIILRKKGWKTRKQQEVEEFEDAVEAMKSLMRKCEDNRARKARWEKLKETMDKDDLAKIQQTRKDYNDNLKPKAKKKAEPGEPYFHAESDNESEDDIDEEPQKIDADSNDESEKEHRAEPAEIEDPQESNKEEQPDKQKKQKKGRRVSFETGPSKGTQTLAEELDLVSKEQIKVKTRAEVEEIKDQALSISPVTEPEEKDAATAETTPSPARDDPDNTEARKEIVNGDNHASEPKAAERQKEQGAKPPGETPRPEPEHHSKARATAETADPEDGRSEPSHDASQHAHRAGRAGPAPEAEEPDQGIANAEMADPENGAPGPQREAEDDGFVPKELQRSNTVLTKLDKQKKANARDKYRHYEFLGEAYIHGMMDGEAVRQNLNDGKPDHVFEIR